MVTQGMVKDLNPKVIPIISRRDTKPEPGIIPDPLLIDARDIKRRICHHEIECVRTFVDILVIGVSFPDITGKTMNGQVHLTELKGSLTFFLSVYRYLTGRVLLVTAHKPSTLHKHATRSTGRVVYLSMVRFDHMDNKLNKANRSEELPSLLSLFHREVAEEILVNLPECVPFKSVWY